MILGQGTVPNGSVEYRNTMSRACDPFPNPFEQTRDNSERLFQHHVLAAADRNAPVAIDASAAA